MNMRTTADVADSAPKRPLSSDFTAVTLRRAQIAKRRIIRKQSIEVLLGMKKTFPMLRTMSGTAFVLAATVVSSVSAYALINWFDGNPTVRQEASIMHVDLSSCKGSLPAGIESTNNRSDVQFKITGSPHISTSALQQQLLVDCEANAAREFYNPGVTGDNSYSTEAATITAVQDRTFTVNYKWAGAMQSKTFTLSTDDPVYVEGQAAQLTEFHPGDFVVVAVPIDTHRYVAEGTDTFATATVHSVFKTHYDTSTASGASKGSGINYQAYNIMPLNSQN